MSLSESFADPFALTRQLSHWANRLTWQQVPEQARYAVRRHLLDTLGCMIAGAGQPLTQDVASVIGAVRSGGSVAIPGFTTTADLLDATYLGAVAAHGLELDDGYREGSTHPGVAVIPAALAMAQQTNATIEQLLTAIVAGYEVMTQIARLAHPAMRNKGFHPTATSGVFGAAVAAACLRKLDAGQWANAMGIAASSAAGLFAFVSGGADVKRLHPGHAAREGVFAVLLAEKGINGPPCVLEGPDGFFQAFANTDAANMLVELPPQGSWGIASCYIKPYPCCRHLHPAVDALFDIMKAQQLRPADISRVEIETYGIAAKHAVIGWHDFASSQLSFPFVMASAMRFGALALKHFDEQARADTHTTDLCARFGIDSSVAMDERYRTGRPAKVTVYAGDQIYCADKNEALGSPQEPVSTQLLEQKFFDLTIPVLGETQARMLAEHVTTIDTELPASTLVALTSSPLETYKNV